MLTTAHINIHKIYSDASFLYSYLTLKLYLIGMSIILDLLFPKTCYGCHRLGYYFCPECTEKFTTGHLNHLTHLNIEAHLSVFNDPVIKKSIYDLKYNFVSHLAPDLAKTTANFVKLNFPLILKYWRQNNFTFIPVPLHYSRLNWRGFNQSELVGEHLATFLKLSINSSLVERSVNTLPQAKTTSKSQRLTNLSSSFTLVNSFNLPKNIIIFDDVFTTGATSLSLARIFPKTTNIWILSLL